ncbi:ATP-binding cassette domain-containing protein [Bacillus marinisedimentorum]|uniref:ATP-binding cassette domain-containing protein n=1 Tax=Bacillus marinisedimentorum TaxID=1821260 RepID=UPI000872BF68|nr:ABC transporter ATP-binding protein [Bacillus marinisedimentorum]
MNVIACSNLTKTYGKAKALNSLSFTIEENTITGLIGRNGAGKTTLLKTIAGQLKQTSGDIHVFGQKPFNNLTVSANMIFVHDQMTLPDSLTLADLLQASKSFYKNWDAGLAERLFNYFNFDSTSTYSRLSKGMKSTFTMIIGLAARCPLTIFDEPTTGMDAAVRKDFYRALLKDYISHPRTMIISSHLLEEIEDLLEDILLIDNGQKLLHLPMIDLKDYAVALSGDQAAVTRFTDGKELFHQHKIGDNHTYTVLRNTFSEKEMQAARSAGIEMSRVSSDDLCIYLTGGTQGGIDDVFN